MHRRYFIPACVLIMLLFVSSISSATTYSATSSGQHAIELSSGSATYENATVTKTGDVSGQSDNYNWQGTNAAVHASGGAQLTLSGSSTSITSNATYGNAVFSYGGNLSGSNSGDGTKIIISDATITTTKNNSGGIMVTGGGVIEASNLTITTSSGSSAAIRSDKGGGTITVNGGTYTTSGTGSPAIYCTAAITGADVTLKSNAAQVVVIEGGNSVTLTDSTLTANHTTLNGQDTTYQAIMIYQSQSGDASDGASTFTMTGGSITNTKGNIFHVTNTTTTITLSDVDITNNDSSGYFLRATADSWGSSGSNGGSVTINASSQDIDGTMLVDSVSTLTLNLSNNSNFNGAINTSVQTGTVKVVVGSGSTWTLTANSYISSLTNNGTVEQGSYTLYVNGTAYDGTSTEAGDNSDSSTTTTSGDAPAITTTSLKDATIGKSYSMSVKATGNKPITWTASNLPDGLSISTSGKISGTPTTAGSYSVKLTASSSTGTASVTLTLKVLNIAPKINVTKKTGAVDEAYSNTFTLKKGTGTITWSLSGNLPEGLSFDADTATLAGIPAEAWKDSVTVTASNDAGTASKKFKLVIKATKPSTTTKSIASGITNQSYSAEIDITGSRTITVSVSGLPDGLGYEYSADKKAVTISGTPTANGKFSVQLTATNSGGKLSKNYKLVVNMPPSINAITLSSGTAGKKYSTKFTAEGTKKITWSVISGDLPSGITLTAKNGKLKGKATSYGTFPFRVMAKNDYGTDSVDVVLTITPVAPTLSGKLKNGTAGSSYSAALKAKGTEPLYWSVSGSLPDGITFSDGTFSGTPTGYFSGNITVTVSNDGGQDSKSLALLIKAVAPKITTTSLASGTQGSEYSATLAATGTPDIVWSWSGNPSGLVLSADTGEISGTPTAAGTFKVKITATNDAKSVSKTIKLVINAASNGTVPEVYGEAEGEEAEFGGEYFGSVDELPEGFVIAAELPEVSKDESGMYDFAVTLSENAPIGAKLYWVANSDMPSYDDRIAEFFGTDGRDIECVPDDRRITVSAWLNRAVKYKPVIAVKK